MTWHTTFLERVTVKFSEHKISPHPNIHIWLVAYRCSTGPRQASTEPEPEPKDFQQGKKLITC